jgi:hypothetical protein
VLPAEAVSALKRGKSVALGGGSTTGPGGSSVMGEEEPTSPRPLSDDGSDFGSGHPQLKRQRTSVSTLSVDVHGQVRCQAG